MLNKPESDFPYAPTLKKSVTWPFLLDWATALDKLFGYVFDNAARNPIVLENLESTGEMQTIALPKPLTAAPAVVRVSVREPPTIKIGMEVVAASYRIEYGAHAAGQVQVKIGHASGATKAKFDVLIWP